MKSHVKTNVYWFTESSPNIHVHPSIGINTTAAFSSDLAIGWDKGKLLYRTVSRYNLHNQKFIAFVII